MEKIQRTNPLKRLLSIRGMGQVLTVTAVLIVLCIIFGIMNPNFFSGRNLMELLRQTTPILLVGIAQSYVLITGNIDLSIGSVLGMSAMISATLMTGGMNAWLAALIGLVCCLAVGVVNGLLVAKFKLPPFVATLGTQTICRGVAQIVNNNFNTDMVKGASADLLRDLFYRGKTLGVFNGIWIVLIVFLVMNFILSRTRTGRHLYAIGSNIDAAKLSGVNVISTTTKAYLASAFCAFLAGLVTMSTTGTGMMDAGTGYETYGVAASVIGGVSTLGGQGILIGTVVGSAIWQVLQNGLNFIGAPVAMKNIAIGAIVVASVLMDVMTRSRPVKPSK